MFAGCTCDLVGFVMLRLNILQQVPAAAAQQLEETKNMFKELSNNHDFFNKANIA